jgi:hypothetical protein
MDIEILQHLYLKKNEYTAHFIKELGLIDIYLKLSVDSNKFYNLDKEKTQFTMFTASSFITLIQKIQKFTLKKYDAVYILDIDEF